MKKAFTLVELLVVMTVIAALMAIMFRITGIGDDMRRRNLTVQRLQSLENCLSGYFAAYGSYPPVALYATHNVYQRADEYGEQEDYEDSELKPVNVLAVCKAQPVACRFPFANDEDTVRQIEKVSEVMRNRANSSDSKFKEYKERQQVLSQGFTGISSVNQVNGWSTEYEWKEVKVFKFGLLSYLLPRYLTMTVGVDKNSLENCRQWTASNELASHPNTGRSFGSWKDELDDVRLVRRIPSQAVCARWMPNLEKKVNCTPRQSEPGGAYTLFGVNVRDPDGVDALSADNPNIEIYEGTPNYVLDSMTVTDGWGVDFFYYSPAPYQSYRLWSAGPNGKTFPPWIPLSSLKDSTDRKTAGNWMADDIMHQSN